MWTKQRTLSASLVVVIALLLSACSHTINQEYNPRMERVASHYTPQISLQVQSEYGNREGVMLAPNFYLGPSYDRWFQRGLATEFQRAGFEVYPQPMKGIPHISVWTTEFSIESFITLYLVYYIRGGAAAATVFDVELYDPGSGRVFQRRFATTRDERSHYGHSPDELEEILREMLVEVYAEIVTETYNLLAQN